MTSEVFFTMISATNAKGRNYFHDACHAGSIPLLCRVQPFLQVEDQSLLQEYDNEGYQPIHVAVMMQGGGPAAYMIELIVVMGADINGRDRLGGDTALHLAIHRSDYYLVEWLCNQANIDIDAVNYARSTPFQLAWTKDDPRLMKILRDHGADTEPPSDSSHDDDSS